MAYFDLVAARRAGGRAAGRQATEAGIDPDRVKFRRTVRIIRRRAADPAFPPDQGERLLAAVMADITSPRNLNPRRRHRSYPRVIRRARHNSYRAKRPGDTGTGYHGPPTIRLVNLSPQPVMINLG